MFLGEARLFRSGCGLLRNPWGQHNPEQYGLVVGMLVAQVNGPDGICPDVRGDVKIIGDGEDGFRAVGYVEVAQGLGRRIPDYAAGAL